jgi:hypothetical protein
VRKPRWTRPRVSCRDCSWRSRSRSKSRGTERLRLTPTTLRSDADIEALVDALSDVSQSSTLREAA